MVISIPRVAQSLLLLCQAAVEGEGQDQAVGVPVALFGRQHLDAAGEQYDIDRVGRRRCRPAPR
ncbi:hypothetical protein [Streptomyces yunnanensis]|uniref:hypothetical protein n=1 Tax=Streptomyces yunnanensis TaxID=156453 RepID=UPI003B83282C